jgi:hypothetical protein
VTALPRYRAGLDVHSASSASSDSSSRTPRPRHGTPAAAYSSGDQPMPNPGTSRPPLTTSIVVSARAATAGAYQGRFSTLNPSLTRSVAVAATVSTVNGSSAVRNSAGIVARPP